MPQTREMSISKLFSNMAEAMPALRIIAQPKASYRARYMCEGRPCRNRAQRFVRADNNPNRHVYPTIEIPNEWTNKSQELLYIRLTHVTVPNEQVDVRCVHPYPIDTEENNVIKDPVTNSLFFPISNDELMSGWKSFQFTLYKLTQYQLKTYGPLRLLNSDEKDEQRLNDPTDPKKLIDIYQLGQSQLLFSIAVILNNQQLPVIYDVSSVFSHIITGTTTTAANDDDMSIRCSPQRGDWQGEEEILMVIPKVDKRKAFSVRFEHPLIDQRSTLRMNFVDTKTISFYTPPCPVSLTRHNSSISIPIVVTQNGVEIARIPFIYQALDVCLNCNINKRPFTDLEEDNEVDFNDLMADLVGKQESDLSHMQNFTTATEISSRMKSEDEFSLLENAIEQGNIDLAIKLTKQTKSSLERKNDQGETPLLLAAKFNQNRLIIAILKKQPELAQQIDQQGNNLLHLLANVQENQAKKTIENVLTLLDKNMKEWLISGLNRRQQTPEQIARKNDNMEYIDLLNRQINFLDSIF